MKYNDYLNTVTDCRFCGPDLGRIIKKGDKSYLTYSLAPYTKHHVLVIPDRHVENYEDLTKEEKEDIDNILSDGIKFIKLLGHKGYSILLRNGDDIGKTIKQ